MKFLKQTIATVPLHGETVLVRVDYNVPLKSDGTIADDFRIRASLPTIKKLLDNGCKLVLISHLGRPKGHDPSLSLEPVAQRLAELLQEPVRFVDKITGDKVKMAIKRAPKHSIIMLENLRFDPREEADDEGFAKALAEDSGARYFVQDGFGTAHRNHASYVAITHYLPSVAGLLLEREYTTITRAMKNPKQPLVAILGGAKVADKIHLITAFIDRADQIIITGAIANAFLSYKGYAMGKSKVEQGVESIIESIYRAAEKKVGKDNVDDFLILPTDLAVGYTANPDELRRVVAVNDIGPSDKALDMGDTTINQIVTRIEKAQTVIWNGTLGMAELQNFAHGSARVALALATHPSITSIIGGGDTADFVLGWDSRKGKSFTHVSTGGGASLALMAGEKLPGYESLLDAR